MQTRWQRDICFTMTTAVPMNGVTTADAGGAGHTEEIWDLADMTFQCGRRGDALKLALSWIYYGSSQFELAVNGAMELAAYMADTLDRHEDFKLLSTNPPPCLQICFYYAPRGKLSEDPRQNTKRTVAMVQRLVSSGFMVDYAPGDRGHFFRAVLNWQTLRGTVDALVRALEESGRYVETISGAWMACTLCRLNSFRNPQSSSEDFVAGLGFEYKSYYPLVNTTLASHAPLA